MKRLFVTGIGTEIGKTVVSAILTEALKADYWKPVQAGEPENTDSMKIGRLLSNHVSRIFPEAYRLSEAMSPHAAAALENITINIDDINVPDTENTLIIEGAGGIMVPLNQKHLMIDLIRKLKARVILVSKNYLGSINHTLLTAEALKSRDIPVEGIVFNGTPNPSTEEIILHYTGFKLLFRVNEEKQIDRESILKYTGIDIPGINSLSGSSL